MRTHGELFLRGSASDVAPCPISNYFWAIRGTGRTLLVDTGCNRAEAERRGRTLDRLPADALRMVGVDPAGIADIVVTHLHWDHVGALEDFPNARLYIQRQELEYAVGPGMVYRHLQEQYTPDHLCEVVRRVHAGRVRFCEDVCEIAPGIEVYHIGGHTKGIQCVRVNTRRGWVVLASDVVHLYENLESRRPFAVVQDVERALLGFDRVRDLASSDAHVIPGHDPRVLERYPPYRPDLRGIVARVDLAPRAWPVSPSS